MSSGLDQFDQFDQFNEFLAEFRPIAFRALKNCKTEEDLRRVNANIQKVIRWLFEIVYSPGGR